MDLNDPSSVEDAIKGANYVVHTASPFKLSPPQDENEFVKPAVNGTLAVMEAAQKHGIKRVVFTSSMAAVMRVNPKEIPEVFDESCWSDPDLMKKDLAYDKSKTLAEKAAWDFI